MIQYLLTALAGIAIGVVAMRVWSARETQPVEHTEAAGAPPRNLLSTRNLLIVAGALVAVAVGAFLLKPKTGEVETAGALVAKTDDGLPDVDTMITRLEKRLKDNPKDGEGYRMLGWSYAMTGNPQKAVAPYERALELLPQSAAVHAGYGEALVGVAGGKVTDKARAHFEQAQRIDRSEARSRYFLAMWDAQNGREKQALDQWIELANSGPADAPWQADLHAQIEKLAKKMGVDVSGRLKVMPSPPDGAPNVTDADVAAASALPQEQQSAMVDGMVEGLAARLASNPKDPEGWARLLRSRMVLGQAQQAASDLRTARSALAGDKAGLATVNAQAKASAVPGA